MAATDKKAHLMTIVARLAIRDYPTLIGDLLLSGPELPGFTPTLPTVKDVAARFPPGSNPVPRGMRQKIAMVTDQLVVGWSGQLGTARDVICELRRKSASATFTMASLNQHFDSLSPAVWKDIGLLGFIRDPNGYAQFTRHAEEMKTTLFGNVGLLGSGSDDVEQFLTGLKQLPNAMEREMNELEQSLGFALHLTGTFLSLEQMTAESISKYYGAGYEIASLMGDRFEKMGDVTYIFWKAIAHDGQPRLDKQPMGMFRYAYIGDMLVIRAFSFENSGQSLRARDDLHYVSPVYRDATPTEQSWVDTPATAPAPALDARWLCNYILTTLPNDKVGILTLVCLKAQGEDKWVKITETLMGTDVRTEIEVSQEFLDLVGRQIGEQLKTTS